MKTVNYETDDDLDELIPKISNWGRWGDEDELGTLNFLTPDKILNASKLIQTGETVSLAREMTISKLLETDDLLRESYSMNKQETFCNDFIGIRFHGWKFTHIDAICHIYSADGKLYNNFSTDSIKETGAEVLGVKGMASRGIVGRGVLVDVPRYKGSAYEPGEIISMEDILKTIEDQGTTIQSGDILLVRSGTGVRNTVEESSGIHPEIIPWLYENEISLIGNDGVSDFIPTRYTKYLIPLHRIVIPYMGMPMLDNADLDHLAEVCKKYNRWEFMLSIAPWRINNTTGSLVNPIAIF